MKDFITLSCPTCGGQLRLGTNSSRYTCEYCGCEHIVRQEDISASLEKFSRCPICGRNDRVEKVSAICKNSNLYPTLAEILEPPPEPAIDGNKFRLLAKPNFPPIPEYVREIVDENSWALEPLSYIFFSLSACIFFILLCTLSSGSQNTLLYLILILLFLAFGILSLVISKKKLNKISGQNQLIKIKNNELKQDWEKKRNEMYNKLLNDWKRLLARRKGLYYCHRDDCIFIPDEGTFASPSDMNKYLNK